MAGLRVTLSSGRDVALTVPVDMSAQEAIDLIGYVATQLPKKLVEAGARHAGSRILVPGGLVGRG